MIPRSTIDISDLKNDGHYMVSFKFNGQNFADDWRIFQEFFKNSDRNHNFFLKVNIKPNMYNLDSDVMRFVIHCVDMLLMLVNAWIIDGLSKVIDIYIPSTINNNYILWYTPLIVPKSE